ncbi:DUF2971 domain-containing protein [Burkholderia sola]|uniref:DUF2971 domain-containing protein n=1 Tax=Burkholderia sola TaxID=2843302 RepID=UPI0023DD6BF5|nr:DUF2971 domain-containing protein [Burkholderia sola]MDF3081485.1 DUF2971 domain-containing protein [Burkholderia sola]
MSDNFDYNAYLQPIWADYRPADQRFPAFRPLIAHYCSIATLEAVVKNEQFWFSNPLYMNDYEELVFGLVNSRDRFLGNVSVRNAFKTPERYDKFREQLLWIYEQFDKGLLFDIYIACFAEHDPADNDGLLSMWRGYGANGSGAALVFNTAALTEIPHSPLRVDPVTYGTSEERLAWVDQILEKFAELVGARDIPEAAFRVCASALFERFLMFSVFTKHRGFREEKEWRVVYSRHYDSNQMLTSMLGYFINGGAVEPKLKFRIAPLEGAAAGGVTLEQLVVKVILGPNGASVRSTMAVRRMLETLGMSALAERVVTSSTPYRAK